MFIKSLVLGTLLVSTPICVFTPQDPSAKASQPAACCEEARESRALQELQRELAEAKRELRDAQRQLGELLDIAEQGIVVSGQDHGQNCQPSRSRALLTHFQWLKQNHHDERAERALAVLSERAGNRPQRLCEMARDLMRDKETAGQFDSAALALVQRVEQDHPALERLDPRLLSTMALAHFLNHDVGRAVELQQSAIERNPNEDDYRVQLRTYQAAQQALALAAASPAVEPRTEPKQEPQRAEVGDCAVAVARMETPDRADAK